ncbi:MAG: hypothetical protein NE327_00075 [Lentisphaeraceae bacterium]|nr:hypothetical protein [Lentisphaeraceae bacterium]
MNLLDVLIEIRTELLKVVADGIDSANVSYFKEFQENLLSLNSKNKALNQLTDAVQNFSESAGVNRVSCFWELNSIVDRLFVALSTFAEGGNECVELSAGGNEGFRDVRLSEVKHLKAALQAGNGSILNLVRESLLNWTYKCRQLMPYFVYCLDLRHTETADLIAKEIIPFYGKCVKPLVYRKVDFTHNAGQERVIRVLLSCLDDMEKESFVSEILSKGDTALKKFILKSVSPKYINRHDLEPLLESRSVELRDLALGLVEK